jgi:chromatin modification-related protein VID21
MLLYAAMRHRKIAPIHLFLRRGANIAVHRTCNESRKRKLRELYKYTLYLDVPDKWASTDQPSESETRFLNDNDIEK